MGVLVHKDIVKGVIGCRPISSRLMTARLRESPFNITIVQVYVPTSSYDNSEVDEFYRELQSLLPELKVYDHGLSSLQIQNPFSKLILGV